MTLQRWTTTPNKGTMADMRVDQPEHSDLDHGFGTGAHEAISHDTTAAAESFDGLGHHTVGDTSGLTHTVADSLSHSGLDQLHTAVQPDHAGASITAGLHFDPAHGHVEVQSVDHDFTAHQSHDGLAGLHDSIHNVGLGFEDHHGLADTLHHDPATDQHHGGLGDFLHH
jgi:hypothetical protein